jgi:hypothetical protein
VAHDSLLGEISAVMLKPDLDSLNHVAAGKLRWLYKFDLPLHVTTSALERRHTLVSKWLVEKEGPLLEPSKAILEALKTACCPHRQVKI